MRTVDSDTHIQNTSTQMNTLHKYILEQEIFSNISNSSEINRHNIKDCRTLVGIIGLKYKTMQKSHFWYE